MQQYKIKLVQKQLHPHLTNPHFPKPPTSKAPPPKAPPTSRPLPHLLPRPSMLAPIAAQMSATYHLPELCLEGQPLPLGGVASNGLRGAASPPGEAAQSAEAAPPAEARCGSTAAASPPGDAPLPGEARSPGNLEAAGEVEAEAAAGGNAAHSDILEADGDDAGKGRGNPESEGEIAAGKDEAETTPEKDRNPEAEAEKVGETAPARLSDLPKTKHEATERAG
ncbi:unnamed protein product [Closterium sp. NIES-64]|nr:unnamed protein product [Closterium sp. NIES-64]